MDKATLKQRLEELAGEVEDLVNEVEEAEPSDRDELADTEDLEAENMHLRAENEILKQRVAALEEQLAQERARAEDLVGDAYLYGVLRDILVEHGCVVPAGKGPVHVPSLVNKFLTKLKTGQSQPQAVSSTPLTPPGGSSTGSSLFS